MYSLRHASRNAALKNNLVSKLLSNQKSHINVTELNVGAKRHFLNISGFAELKKVQEKVINSEKKFYEILQQRKQCQDKLIETQNRLKDIHSQLPKLERGDETYLDLVTQEYEAIKTEKALLRDFKNLEKAESEHFALFSSALSESNRKQKARMEQARKWPFMASLIGATAGILGTTLIYFLLSDKTDDTDDSEPGDDLKTLLERMRQLAQSQYESTVLFLSDLRAILIDTGGQVKLKLPNEDSHPRTNRVYDLETIKRLQPSLDNDFEDVMKLLAKVKESKDPSNVVCVGSELTEMLDELEGNTEWKIKKNALAHVCVASGLGFLTFSIIYAILKSVA